MDLQGGSGDIWQDTATPQPATAGPSLNQEPITSSTGSSGGTGDSGGTSGGQTYGSGTAYSGPTQAELDAQKIGELRDQITARRQRANEIFAALTDAVKDVARERTGRLEEDFVRQTGQIRDTALQTNSSLGTAFAGRGAYDSSWRVNSQDRAAGEAKNAQLELGRNREDNLAKIGAYLSQTLAQTGADKDAIEDMVRDAPDDIDALTSIRERIEDRIRELQVEREGIRTNEGFMGKLAKVVPGLRNIGGAVKNALDALVKAAIPTRMKNTLASGIINSYSPEEQALWQKYYNDQLVATEAANPEPTSPEQAPTGA